MNLSKDNTYGANMIRQFIRYDILSYRFMVQSNIIACTYVLGMHFKVYDRYA